MIRFLRGYLTPWQIPLFIFCLFLAFIGLRFYLNKSTENYLVDTTSYTSNEASYTAANHSHSNTPVNAMVGPGLSDQDYLPSEVGTILSQNDTGKAVSGVVMHNGYLFVPMGADHGGGKGAGAFAFYDVSDQKNPVKVFDSRNHPDRYHNSASPHYVGNWGEVHSLPIIGNRMVITETANDKAGIAIFDATNFYDNDPNTLPEIIGRFSYPGVTNPTNYGGYSFSLAAKGGKYVYAPTGSYGLYIIDISDPTAPQLLNHIPTAQLSSISVKSATVMGDLLVLSDANSGNKLLIMDITDPVNPVQVAFKQGFGLGYQGFLYGSEYFTTKGDALRSYDISNLSNITTKTYNGNTTSHLDRGEYGFGKDNFVFIGHYPGLTKWDLQNPSAPVVRCEPINPTTDDYAFLTPLGSAAVISSDHNHPNKLNFGVHQAQADRLPPSSNYVLPKDGSTLVHVNASVGISFTDFIDALSVHSGTIEVTEIQSNVVVEGTYNQMFGFVSFVPNAPLNPNRTYKVTLKAGGVKDWSGNAITEDSIISTFSTGDTITTVIAPKIGQITPISAGETATFNIDLQGQDISEYSFSWDYGDGTPQTSYSNAITSSHQYTTGGNFMITLFVRYESNNQVVQITDTQPVYNPLASILPSRSAKIIYDQTNSLVWNINPDNNSVSAINAENHSLVYEVPVGGKPQSLALTGSGQVWVVNKDSADISIIDASTGNVISTQPLTHGSSPVSILVDTASDIAYIALEGSQQIVKINTTTTSVINTLEVGSWPGNMALDAVRKRLWVSKFISPDDAGKVSVINTDTFTIDQVISLQPSQNPDAATNGRGIPNYLGALAISPDGTQLFIPSKKDNIFRGNLRDGLPITFETTVRSMGAQIDLETNQENFNDRIDFNNSDFANSAVYSPNGNRLFVTTNGTGTIWIVDPFNLENRSEVNSGGQAPDDMVVSPDGKKLFVHNFMSRTVVVFDSDVVCNNSCGVIEELQKVNVVTTETLAADVLKGKQLFYNSTDIRISQDGYMSCASCHLNGGHDGRVWDFSSLGEGFRNTIDLQDKGRSGHGRAHWSSNFDEVQDFENQMRTLSGGSGLMANKDFAVSESTLGTPKKGKSKDLDALAAYLKSLVKVGDSPHTNNGELTPKAALGKQAFSDLLCIRCHGGGDFTDSPTNNLHDIGTLKPTSGMRLGQQLPGIDTPSLRGLWFSEPYLHDGSAATLEDAINAHNSEVTKPGGAVEMENLVAYLLQLSDSECLVSTGTPCNDFNASTTNDVYNSNCECIGEPVACAAVGELVYEVWNDISGNLVIDLISNDNYPYNASTVTTLTGVFEKESEGSNNYGDRAYGVLCAPETGAYTFWVSGDDWTELHLSTDKNPINSVIIAHTGGFSGFRQWDKRSVQESAPITLNAGEEYYFQLLHKEGYGGDHFSVGWRLPSGTLERPMTTANFSKAVIEVANDCHIKPFFKVGTAAVVENNLVALDENDSLELSPESEEFGPVETGWLWLGPQNFTSNTRTVNLTNVQMDQEGTYSVYHTNEHGCTSVEHFYVDVMPSLSVGDVNQLKAKVYPNPAVDLLVIESSIDLGEAQFTVTDINGKYLLENEKLSVQSPNKIILKTDNWAVGFYILTITNGAEKTVKKIIKQR